MSVVEKALETDFDSHHIEGYVAIQGALTPIHVPLISHIEGNLWTGGCKDVALPEDFKYVVSLYMWEEYEIPASTTRITVKMYDSSAEPDSALINALGQLVHDLSQHGKTLVHCQAGLNRSNLIAAKALMVGGRTASEAIALLRAKRSHAVLCNATFERWLLTQTPEEIEVPQT